jgi:DNA-binding CsgD family transcriptional regulator
MPAPITDEPEILLDSTVAMTIGIWATGGSMKQVMRKLGISMPKVRRILVDNGLIDTEESLLYADGHSPAEIAQMMNKTKNAVQGRLPYQKGMYNKDNPTTNALRIRACRIKKARESRCK